MRTVHVAVSVLGVFSFLRSKPSKPPARRVEIVPAAPIRERPPPPAGKAPSTVSIRRRELEKPGARMTPNEMTCPDCGRVFRYFTNANGSTTSCNCPRCGRDFRL